MSTGPSNRAKSTDARIDAYLDGAMAPEERAAFERDMAKDASLRETIELNQRIEASLGRLFEQPAVFTGAVPPGTRRRAAWMGIAAVLVLSIAGVLWMMFGGEGGTPPQKLYSTLVATGYKPMWKCESDERFAEAVRVKLGTAVVVPLATPGVEVLGWRYPDEDQSEALGRNTLILLTRVQGDEVVVLMSRLTDDRELTVPKSAPVKLFRKELAGLVLYEITPREKAEVMQAAVEWGKQ